MVWKCVVYALLMAMAINDATVARHAGRVYDAMSESAENGVFLGNFTDVFKRLKISNSMYSRIRNGLVRNACVEILQRGNSQQPSAIRLVRHPVEVDVSQWDLTMGRRGATIQEIEQRVDNIERRIGTIDFAQMFQAIEERFTKLENKKERK